MTRETTPIDSVRLSVRDVVGVGVLVATATSAILWTQLAVYQRLAVLEAKVEALQRPANAARLAALPCLLLLAGCSTTKGFLGTGIGAAPPAPAQPEGFGSVHWVGYAGGFLMVAIGAALFWLFDRPKAGAGMAFTGLSTLALALAAAYYGQELAFASFVLLGCGIVGALGYMGWYAWTKRAQLREVVTKANGHLEGLSLTRPTARAVAKIKGNA